MNEPAGAARTLEDADALDETGALDPLDDLDAEVAIRRVMTAYMAACDAHDADAVAVLFHDDARFSSLSGGEPPLHGPDEVRESYRIACARLSFCVHYLTDEQIVVDGDHATATWSYFEPATNRGDLAVWTAGRYEHELSRREGVWRFSSFKVGGELAAPYDVGWVPDAKVPLP